MSTPSREITTPDLFVEELAVVVGKLRDGTDAERQQFAARGARIVWRILMPKCRAHVYYRVDEAAAEVEVLLVWNAVAVADYKMTHEAIAKLGQPLEKPGVGDEA